MINHILDYWDIPKNYDIQIRGNKEMEPRVWLINDNFFLKSVENKEIVENLEIITESLLESGLPAAAPIKTKSGELYIMENGKTYFLTPMLSGKTFDNYWEYDWQKYGNLVGQVIAHFQNAVKKSESFLSNIKSVDYYKKITEWVVPIIKGKLSIEEIAKVLSPYDEYQSVFPSLYYKLPRQLIHNDFHGNNILFNGDTISGFIDLDTYETNVRLFDPVYFAGWLLWRMRDDKDKWLPTLPAILSGYNSVNKLTDEEIDTVFFLFYSMDLYCIAVFLQANINYKVKHNIESINWFMEKREYIQEFIINLT